MVMRGSLKQSDSQKTIIDKELGTLLLKKSKRVRRISIVVRPDTGIVVNVPFSVAYSVAEAFVASKADWIHKAKQKVDRKRTVFTEQTIFKTRLRQLRLLAEDRKNVRLKLTPTTIDVSYPLSVPVTHPSVQEAIVKSIEYAWRVEANELLPDRVNKLAVKHGFTYKKVMIKANRSNWGSCTADNIINLSLHVMRMPDELVDYIILHELCHTEHKNHGVHFWALLDKLAGGRAKLLAKQVKTYSTRVV